MSTLYFVMKIDVTDHVRREIECLFNDNHRKGKMMIMRMKTSGSQVDSPVAEGKRKESKSTKKIKEETYWFLLTF